MSEELVRKLRLGIVLKSSPAGGIGGVAIDHDFEATKQLMSDAADEIERLAALSAPAATQPDVDAIAREAAEQIFPETALYSYQAERREDIDAAQIPIAAAIRRAIQEVVMPIELNKQAVLILEHEETRHKHAEAIAVLKEVEWVRYQCPACRATEGHPHKQGCCLAKAIGK